MYPWVWHCCCNTTIYLNVQVSRQDVCDWGEVITWRQRAYPFTFLSLSSRRSLQEKRIHEKPGKNLQTCEASNTRWSRWFSRQGSMLIILLSWLNCSLLVFVIYLKYWKSLSIWIITKTIISNVYTFQCWHVSEGNRHVLNRGDSISGTCRDQQEAYSSGPTPGPRTGGWAAGLQDCDGDRFVGTLTFPLRVWSKSTRNIVKSFKCVDTKQRIWIFVQRCH